MINEYEKYITLFCKYDADDDIVEAYKLTTDFRTILTTLLNCPI